MLISAVVSRVFGACPRRRPSRRDVTRSLMLAVILTVPAALGLAGLPSKAQADPDYAIAMHGEPAYSRDFTAFDYVNPDAPRGGRLTIGVVGTYDSLNPFIVQGIAAAGLRGHVFQSLMTRGLDEPFTLYGLLAETIDVADDRSSVTFTINGAARFSDGSPVLADDVLFSWEVLRTKGRPNYRTYYNQVDTAEQLDERTVRFTFAGPPDREMPMIMALMPILPRAHYADVTFDRSSSALPVGSGPYTVGAADLGKSITYRRNPDYWGRDLAVERGRFNFDEIKYDYFRNDTALLEAFKKGLVDILPEENPARWATDYSFPAVRDGRVVLDKFDNGQPRGMSALVFNTRRPVFADIRVREALLILFDAEWINKTLYHDLYQRTESFYPASELSAHDRPASDGERELLGPWIGEIRPDILDGSYALPQTDGSGRDRDGLRRAIGLLEEAGYTLVNGVMTNGETGAPLSFEILVATPDQERLALSYARFLKRAGITAAVRQVDSAQFERRRQTFDFDMMPYFWFSSLSPGNEQKFYWGSEAAASEGSRNYMGVADPAVDAMIEAMLAAEKREDFVDAVRALDRVLMSGLYMVPLYHLPKQWVARWSRIERPERTSLYGYDLDSWWFDGDAN